MSSGPVQDLGPLEKTIGSIGCPGLVDICPRPQQQLLTRTTQRDVIDLLKFEAGINKATGSDG